MKRHGMHDVSSRILHQDLEEKNSIELRKKIVKLMYPGGHYAKRRVKIQPLQFPDPPSFPVG